MRGPRSIFRLIPFTLKQKAPRRQEPPAGLRGPGPGCPSHSSPVSPRRPPGGRGGWAEGGDGARTRGRGKPVEQMVLDAGEWVRRGGHLGSGNPERVFSAEEGCGEDGNWGSRAGERLQGVSVNWRGQVQVGVRRRGRTLRRAPHTRTANPWFPLHALRSPLFPRLHDFPAKVF